jgi:hypothetical protein
MRVSRGSKILKILKVLKNKQKEIANSVDNSTLFFCFLSDNFFTFFWILKLLVFKIDEL